MSLIIVAGIPRSGTSLTMNILRHALGDELILGYSLHSDLESQGKNGFIDIQNLPMFANDVDPETGENRTSETKKTFERLYKPKELVDESKVALGPADSYLRDSKLSRRVTDDAKAKKEIRDAIAGEVIRKRDERSIKKDKRNRMNPDGFWETPFVVRGISYRNQEMDDFLLNNRFVMKIVNSGLLTTDPKYIERIVYVLRTPESTIISHKDVFSIQNKKNADAVNAPYGVRDAMIDLSMYTKGLVEAATFFILNPNIPTHFIIYEDLVKNGSDSSLPGFIAEGDWEKGFSVIKPKLNRSSVKSEEDDVLAKLSQSTYYDLPKLLYEAFKAKDFKRVLELNFVHKNYNKEHFICPRLGRRVTSRACASCKSDEVAVSKLKWQAEKKGIDWASEPCLWDVQYSPSYEGTRPTVEESINSNHWSKSNVKFSPIKEKIDNNVQPKVNVISREELNELHKELIADNPLDKLIARAGLDDGAAPTVEPQAANTDDKFRQFRQKYQLGSKVEKITKAAGIKTCGGCAKRKAWLNGEDPPAAQD